MNLTHGTRHAYNLGCRCYQCRECNREHQRERRKHVRTLRVLIDGELVSPYAEHGTTNGYGNWQCRCTPCVEAHSAKCRYYSELRKQRKVLGGDQGYGNRRVNQR